MMVWRYEDALAFPSLSYVESSKEAAPFHALRPNVHILLVQEESFDKKITKSYETRDS